MKICTNRLTLRLPQEGDAVAMQKALDDFEVTRMLQVVPYPYTLDMARDFVSLTHAEWQKNASCILAVTATDQPDLGLLGVVGTHHWCSESKTVELGYWFARPAWGKGYATEAAKAICDFAFGHWPLEKIVSSVFADNPASRKVIEKLGFNDVGTSTIYSISRASEVQATNFELLKPQTET